MPINYSIAINVYDSVSADKQATLTRRILQVLESQTLSIEYHNAYDVGANSTNQIRFEIGSGNINFAIRIIFETDVIGSRHSGIVRRIFQVLEGEPPAGIQHAESYNQGTRVYNLVITLS